MNDNEAFEKRVGTTLRGKWTLERLLGVGGMAAVYVGVHKIGRRDAIKILHPEIARSNDLRARFEQEAHAVNRFRHPGAVEIRDIDTSEDGAPFLVMELLQGEPLSERARRLGGIELGETLRYVDELLDVLAAAHTQGIIHRDIKLDNLFIQEDGHLKVLDFGIARMRDGAPKTMNTRTGATLGTLPYMPPEQVKGLTIDGRADLFAVGATMFRLIAKRRIHEASNESELLVKMATQPAPALSEIAHGTPQGVCLVVDRALAFLRDRRYPDAATMQEDVRAVRRGEAPAFASARLAAGDLPNVASPVGASGQDGTRAPSLDATVAAGNGVPKPAAPNPFPASSELAAPTRVTAATAAGPSPASVPIPPAPPSFAGPPVSEATAPASWASPIANPFPATPVAARDPRSRSAPAPVPFLLIGGVLVLVVLLGSTLFWVLHKKAPDDAEAIASASASNSGEPPPADSSANANANGKSGSRSGAGPNAGGATAPAHAGTAPAAAAPPGPGAPASKPASPAAPGPGASPPAQPAPQAAPPGPPPGPPGQGPPPGKGKGKGKGRDK